jgi:hypothetical protein
LAVVVRTLWQLLLPYNWPLDHTFRATLAIGVLTALQLQDLYAMALNGGFPENPNWADFSPMLYPYLQQLPYSMLPNGIPMNGASGAPRFPFDFGSLGPKMPFTFENDGVKDDPKVELEDKELWDQFNTCTNEVSTKCCVNQNRMH